MNNNNFQSKQYIFLEEKNLKDKTLEEYIFQTLSIYDFYEVYDKDKKYLISPYIFEFIKNTPRTYENHLLTIKYLPTNQKYKYIVSYEIVAPKELELLKKYCQCEKHRTSYFNIKRYLLGGCDVGCLHYDIGKLNMNVVYKTRKYVKEYKYG